ncbi:bifunctional serine/threonine-protein kinase/universal stress protein [Undibacterium sp. 5I1]|uniref:bifunctional serine/threonine-protein kinase/universal stress protein n=1 Tax=unclassified Undibacterium TaxID=2630295 RepID=UPI002AB33FE4|nr:MULTISPECIES: bifunctional serine/threonine-protein kinase/universal stress protein [unclassified Undibacterium]MDY7540054.1 bifunctional serine/threonine-protein kinase/universal stress protein [Undibacterium sp. 5I1]MEB0232622.1 bifunctional serine/threonine-protein kinase/universal stress protein [Undibacterium sp. 10I3]MEB0257901.1 bifunctional serine/threonine-protein kinase/universal stress protein [Undibacterium sp. 5I1]
MPAPPAPPAPSAPSPPKSDNGPVEHAKLASSSPLHHRVLHTGMQVNGYLLEEKLHTGGMAALWRISDLQQRHPPELSGPGDIDEQDTTQPALIMKVPLLFSSEDPTAIVAFEVEQMIMPKLKGKHVPRYFGSGDFDAQPYIVMEHIAGESLRSRFDQAPPPVAEVVDIGIKIAHALQDLHRQGVIHLDIKPSNIMFRADGSAVLIDFGLSRHDKLPDLLDEEFRLPLGTGPYISPEQVLGVRNEPRSDLFALGVLLYHLATGQRPYGYPTTVNGLKKRLYRDPIPPRSHNPNIPDWLQEIILRCLEVNPAARFDTAAQLALSLQYPDQLTLTDRAAKTGQDGYLSVLKRRFQAAGSEPALPHSVTEQLSQAPIIMVALDLSNPTNASTQLADSLRNITERTLQTKQGARLACVTVRKVNRIGMDDSLIQQGQNIHVKQLVDLKHWARPLNITPDKITFHVLEAHDPATAILDYANNNDVDHIIIGSRGSSAIKRYLGSVSTQVVAESHCTVTVVKVNEK